jgi:hypothetical protein
MLRCFGPGKLATGDTYLIVRTTIHLAVSRLTEKGYHLRRVLRLRSIAAMPANATLPIGFDKTRPARPL